MFKARLTSLHYAACNKKPCGEYSVTCTCTLVHINLLDVQSPPDIPSLRCMQTKSHVGNTLSPAHVHWYTLTYLMFKARLTSLHCAACNKKPCGEYSVTCTCTLVHINLLDVQSPPDIPSLRCMQQKAMWGILRHLHMYTGTH